MKQSDHTEHVQMQEQETMPKRTKPIMPNETVQVEQPTNSGGMRPLIIVLTAVVWIVVFGVQQAIRGGWPFGSTTGNNIYEKYEGTWSSPNNTIVVKLNAATMKAHITLTLGDTPISYISNWEIVEGRGIVYNDYYGHGQASFIGFDGEFYTFDSNTRRLIDNGFKMKHTK